jgi:hypothetical protein
MSFGKLTTLIKDVSEQDLNGGLSLIIVANGYFTAINVTAPGMERLLQVDSRRAELWWLGFEPTQMKNGALCIR